MAVSRALLKRCGFRGYIRKLQLLPYSCQISHISSHPFQFSHKQQQCSLLDFHGAVAPAPVAAAFSFNQIHTRNLSTTSVVLQLPQIQPDVASFHQEQPSIQPHGNPSFSGEQGFFKHGFSAAYDSNFSHSAVPFEIASLDMQTLGREMNTCLARENPMEAVKMFEEWKSAVNGKTGQDNLPNRALFNLYLHSRLKLGASYQDLCNVVKEMEDADMPPDLQVYNFLLRAIFRQRDSLTAETLLAKMEQSGIEAQPDGDSYNLLVVLCALDKRIDSALKYFQTMLRKGFEPSKMTINEVILAASRLHHTRVAVALLTEIQDADKIPMLTTCAELLVAAADVDDAECASLALDLIRQRPTGKFTPSLMFDEGTLLAVLSTAARKGDGALTDKVWDTLVKSLGDQQHPSPALYHARIHAHSAAGNLTAAFCGVEELQSAYGKLEDDTNGQIFSPFSSLRPLVLACLRGGAESLDAAYYLLEEFHAKKHVIALASINCIILGCSNAWDVDRAYQTFQSIGSVFALRPDVHSYNALIAGLAKTKQRQ
ncbi:hypothetical protein O6H91_15G033700 [Diphasiastrum complanatum]|uniref:Uncharacterized protein n=5 Tax=Diphasiastrum complanatum TaxID=34168 RepID=A0ACC2BI36_DIPCM|nr:hypothetical protein O6H91_15G033700 [Diphasiastrum complanatum]KAJ7529094.1 hypothetical protein O6H91_15G033700 [Diphasiastrum complanatum]KAJ7529097.1 hypothetical protein O6H91_15G033700 [Diphasiastrum complanatum]KAJ7529098.1 hypothetical protein O6H91_15G033700 [Diphasiastrum complanatum]KAJ7529099.1 hypothetical protein O6H91_15G033700 [Diphasiastrum complanatum]